MEDKWVLHNFNYHKVVEAEPSPSLPEKVPVKVITRRWYEMIDTSKRCLGVSLTKEKTPA